MAAESTKWRRVPLISLRVDGACNWWCCCGATLRRLVLWGLEAAAAQVAAIIACPPPSGRETTPGRPAARGLLLVASQPRDGGHDTTVLASGGLGAAVVRRGYSLRTAWRARRPRLAVCEGCRVARCCRESERKCTTSASKTAR